VGPRDAVRPKALGSWEGMAVRWYPKKVLDREVEDEEVLDLTRSIHLPGTSFGISPPSPPLFLNVSFTLGWMLRIWSGAVG
jgi:hypothetical protein